MIMGSLFSACGKMPHDTPYTFRVANDPTGIFSDNLVTVLPDAPKVLRYRPGTPTSASSLRRRISLIDLRGSY